MPGASYADSAVLSAAMTSEESRPSWSGLLPKLLFFASIAVGLLVFGGWWWRMDSTPEVLARYLGFGATAIGGIMAIGALHLAERRAAAIDRQAATQAQQAENQAAAFERNAIARRSSCWLMTERT